MIIREKYLSKIRPFYDKDLIKVIIGMRRCGKSVVLNQIIDELKNNGIEEEQIIYLNFEFEDYYDLCNHLESNSDLLSGELATHIAGRYVSFKIYPFTFKEVCELKNIVDKNKFELQNDFNDYIIWGGMPQRFVMDDEYQTRTYLADIFNSIVIKDIVDRFKIKDLDLFNRIINYIVTTPSQTFSAESLSNYLLGENIDVSKITIYNYLDYMCKALLINKVERYDVRGKRILNGKYKYYLSDLGLGQVVNKERKKQMGAYLENIVYNELISRGYDVKVGNFENGEVDFIATRFDEKIYLQVAYVLADETVVEREFGVYKNIQDNYPKYVISTDSFDMSQDGIIHKNIIDWLLQDN